MKKKFLVFTLIGLLGTILILTGCDNNNGDIELGLTECSNEDDGNNVNCQLHLLRRTVWLPDGGVMFIEFSNSIANRIVFKYRGIGGVNGIIAYGNFRLLSYDGVTMKLLDYDNLEVAFTVIISENKMTVNGLGSIKWAAFPADRRNFSSWNQTYTKDE